MALAWAFGASRMADAFYVAFRIPNLLRRLTAEGALTIAFVPIFTEYLRKSKNDARMVASIVFTYLSIILVLITIFGIVFAPWIVKVLAYGFTDEPGKIELTIYLTRLMFPYIILISLVALAMGILNSLKHFAAPAASPVVLNIGIIFGAIVLSRYFDMQVTGAAIGVLLGGICQLLLQIPNLKREGMLPYFSLKLHPALKGLLLLMIPSAIGAAVYQLNVLVVTFLASFLKEGSVSYLWYADRVTEFPLGIFGIAVATVTLPTLSDHISQKNMSSFKDTMNYSLRFSFLISIPSTAALYLLSFPIVKVLFQRGRFDDATAVATAFALQFFALKIPFVSAVRNLVPGFFAMRDAKTPVYVSAIVVVVNAMFALVLMKSLSYAGLALALALSSIVNFAVLLYLFRKKVGLIGGRRLALSIFKTSIATIVMMIIIYFPFRDLGETAIPLYALILKLSLAMIIGVVVFMVVIRVLSPEDFEAVIGMVRRKKITPSSSECSR